MSDCLFCKIIANEIPCDKVYEDADVIAILFLVLAGKNPGAFIPGAACV